MDNIMKELLISRNLIDIFDTLLNNFGKRHWWPGDTTLEIIFGCILTQNVTWKNVEQAVLKLKKHNLIDVERILSVSHEELGTSLISTRYYNQKACSLKNFCYHLKNDFSNSIDKLFEMDVPALRQYLLSLKGIGKETADSIILYAANKPIFVVDAYTKRIFSRLGYFHSDSSYDQIQDFFTVNLPCDLYVFNEFHALIVYLGQNICKNTNPLCNSCVLRGICNRL